MKYRCVPKIGFSAGISIDILMDILTEREEGAGRREGGKEWTFSQNLTTPHRRVGKNDVFKI